MNYTVNTPEGTKDRLFAECLERRRVQSGLTHLFRQRGYAEVNTPEMEYYDLFLRSGNPLPQEAMLKVIDRSGKICVMRPDCTTPIARVAATKLKTLPFPQRLYYNQTVFRSGTENAGGSSEIAQCGVELIGASGLKADLEMVAMAVDALRACGLVKFHIELGHAGFFRDLAAKMDMEAETIEKMRKLIEGKNFAALGDFLEPFRGENAAHALKRLSHLFGGTEVLDEAEALSGGSQAISYLGTLYAELSKAGYGEFLRFDLGLVHQIDYYTGVVFRGYVEGAAGAVLSGGRYDTLVGDFGREADATGFAVDVDAVSGCLPAVEPPQTEVLIHYESDRLRQAVAAVDARKSGTCELSFCGTLEESRRLASEKGIQTLLVIDKDGEREVPV